MTFLKNITQNLRLFISKFLKIDLRSIKKNIYKNQETPSYDSVDCLRKSKGILHIGAHRGSERVVYDWLGKEVIWIEANPKIFNELKKNLVEFKYQESYKALLHSKSGELKDFFLSSNDHASSSIYDFSQDFKDNKLFSNWYLLDVLKFLISKSFVAKYTLFFLIDLFLNFNLISFKVIKVSE